MCCLFLPLNGRLLLAIMMIEPVAIGSYSYQTSLLFLSPYSVAPGKTQFLQLCLPHSLPQSSYKMSLARSPPCHSLPSVHPATPYLVTSQPSKYPPCHTSPSCPTLSAQLSTDVHLAAHSAMSHPATSHPARSPPCQTSPSCLVSYTPPCYIPSCQIPTMPNLTQLSTQPHLTLLHPILTDPHHAKPQPAVHRAAPHPATSHTSRGPHHATPDFLELLYFPTELGVLFLPVEN
jgi:hypothetical protein